MSYRRPGAAPGNYSRTPTCTHRQTLCANSSPTTLSALSFAPCKPGANVHHDRTRVVRCDTRRHNILRTEKRQQRKGNKECVSCCVSTREALVFTSCPRSHAHLDHGLAAIELRERKEDSSGRGVRRRTTRPLTAASRSAAQPSRFQSSLQLGSRCVADEGKVVHPPVSPAKRQVNAVLGLPLGHTRVRSGGNIGAQCQRCGRAADRLSTGYIPE